MGKTPASLEDRPGAWKGLVVAGAAKGLALGVAVAPKGEVPKGEAVAVLPNGEAVAPIAKGVALLALKALPVAAVPKGVCAVLKVVCPNGVVDVAPAVCRWVW